MCVGVYVGAFMWMCVCVCLYVCVCVCVCLWVFVWGRHVASRGQGGRLPPNNGSRPPPKKEGKRGAKKKKEEKNQFLPPAPQKNDFLATCLVWGGGTERETIFGVFVYFLFLFKVGSISVYVCVGGGRGWCGVKIWTQVHDSSCRPCPWLRLSRIRIMNN